MRQWFVILGCMFGLVSWLRAAEEPEGWRIDSDVPVEFDLETGLLVATNGVTVHYRGTKLSARRARLNQPTGEVEAEGDVRLERQGQLWVGEKVRYNFNTGRMSGEKFRTGQPPAFAQGEIVVADQPADVYVLSRGSVTSDDVAKPAYRIQTRTLIIVPGEFIEARHATLRFGDVPVFYFPYFRRSLKENAPHFTFTPGYRSDDGPFLLTTYHWYWSQRLDGQVHIDERVDRGLGVGPDLHWQLPKLGEGTAKYYYMRDRQPGEDARDVPIDRDRYRIWFNDLAEPRTNLTVRGVVRYQSDEEIVRDFFEGEYKDNIQPSTFVEVNQLWSNYSLNALAQPRVNDFFETVERLPDIKLTGFRQQIGSTPLYYENETTLGYYDRRFAYDLTNHFAAARGDTFHQITLPRTLFNWLNVTPRVGGRFTHYSEADGPGGVTEEEDRWLMNTGGEVSLKASRVWAGSQNRFFQIDGIRHIAVPSINYTYIPDPSPDPGRLPQFDYLTGTTRLLPIDFPDFNAVDSIESQSAMRFGLRNKLQTKRKGAVDNLLHWALYMDWHLDPNPTQDTYSDFYSDLDLKPFSWLTLSSENRYDINIEVWREANHAVTFSPNDRWSLSLGQRYLNDDPLLGPDSGHNVYFSTLYYRLNENWGLRLHHRYEAEDSILQEQSYTLYRDLRSWTAAVTLRVREEVDGPTDLTAAVTFQLKSFPRFGLGQDINQPTRLLGY